MSTIVMNKKDELIMKLVHYFITEQNYNPIVVNGVKDEIWLENTKGPYRIIRINSNSIFNREQLDYDYYKAESITRQIKKKTLSFHVDMLNILLELNEDLKLTEKDTRKNITNATINSYDPDIKDEKILEAFPDINSKILKSTDGVELIINVTKDINEKTNKENKNYEDTFKPKKIIITPIIMFLCLLGFVIELGYSGLSGIFSFETRNLLVLGANNATLVQDYHEVWRLVSYMFLHGSLIHLLVNMYSLYIIGTQLETYLGRFKYLTIYIISGICGGMLSCIASHSASVGASGAIFGLLGAMAYFGYHYRLYLGNVLKNEIIPIIVLNLFIGFTIPGIDNFCHIGGLIGGFFAVMALGIKNKSEKTDRINGFICLIAFMGVMIYKLFF